LQKKLCSSHVGFCNRDVQVTLGAVWLSIQLQTV